MSAIGDAAAAILALDAGMRHGYDAAALPGAEAAIAALTRLIEASGWHVDLASLLNALMAGDVAPGDIEDARRALGEMAMQEALSAACTAPKLRDGQPAVLASGAAATSDDVSWRCWARRHSTCASTTLSRGAMDDCRCACHATPAPSRPATPPPPYGSGDEEADERAAASHARDTWPPSSEHRELCGMAVCGADDTEPPAPGSTPWWDDELTVRL